MRAEGVDLPQPTVIDRLPGGTVISGHDSDPLPLVLRDMMKYSTNMTAEAVGMMASQQRRDLGTWRIGEGDDASGCRGDRASGQRFCRPFRSWWRVTGNCCRHGRSSASPGTGAALDGLMKEVRFKGAGA